MAEIFATIATIGGLVGAADKIKQYVLHPIKAQFSYLFRYSNFIQGLRVKNDDLNSTRDNLQLQIQADKDDLRIISPQVENWCRRVDELKGKTEKILRNEAQVQNGTCLQGTCPDLKLRYSESREALKLTADVVELLDEYRKFSSHISDPAPLVRQDTIPATSDTHEFDSRKQKEEEIMSCLKDDSICMIGVWGMGGVGKTTMAKKIAERAIKENIFDKTVMAVVSQQVDLFKIQQQLAEPLGLHLTQETVPVRAERLHTRLTDKNVLIILDDVWKWLDMKEIGIPSKVKLLLTTRDHRVCKMMFKKETTRILNLKVLGDNEAISLFRVNAGSIVDKPNFLPLAVKLAKECKGLPLALVTVGRSLREETDELIWKESLEQLQKSEPANIPDYLEGVYKPLQLSYDKLESDEARYLFLLCCLFPEDSEIEIENLVHYGVGLKIVSAQKSVNAARSRVNYLVKKLIDRCLLMDATRENGPKCVQMHDVIRDMALFIASRISRGKHVFMVSHDKSLNEWPCENYTCISLTFGEVMTFPESIRCPGLNALLLTFNLWTTTPKLPINFFNGMDDLTLLSICGKGAFSLNNFVSPLQLTSLSSLTKLQALRLHGCDLEDISLIGQLKNLEILSCCESDIQVLPEEIGALKKLKLLDMTNCKKLKNIAQGVFSSLQQLEELRLMGCPIRWECKEKGNERRNASLAQVFSLKKLCLLEIWIQDLGAIFQEMNNSQNLTCYSILIHPLEDRLYMAGSSTDVKRMSIKVNERIDFPITISRLLKGAEQLKLEGNGCKGIIELLRKEGFGNTKSLQIDKLDSLEMIYDGPPPPVEFFSKLEYLSLFWLNRLMYLWKCPDQKFSLSNLKSVKISWCRDLKWVFPLSIAESLCQFERIEVSHCPMMEEVFKDEKESENSSVATINHLKFPNLKTIVLRELPMLGALCSGVDAVIECPSIEELEVDEFPLQKVFGRKLEQNFHHLKSSLSKIVR